MAICAACGNDNPATALFCMACGAPIAPPGFGGGRKTVTIVFCDVVGSTLMGDALDPEAVRGVLTRFFEEMRAVLDRHGGSVEKYIGDAVVAVFGVPTLHEDDALRAVRAAVDMRSALASLNEELEARGGLSITTRTGVNTGEVIVGDPTTAPTVVGDAVNVAARLQQAASPGEILLGRDTYRLVREFVAVDEASSLVLKGKRLPVTAYRLTRLTSGPREGAPRAEPRLVGRRHELRVLQEAFERAVTDTACRLLTVIGPAGAGKSRLAREFLSRLGEEAIVVSGRCLPYGEGITFWPVAEAVRQLARIDADDPLEVARLKLEAVLLSAEDSGLLFDRVAAVTGLNDATAGMQETFWAIRRLLEWVGRSRPLVLWLDDLQWAEPALLDLLEYLVSSCRGAPILVLCLARADLLEERPDWAAQLPNAATIHLAPLDDAETARLIDDLLQGRALPEGLRSRITDVGGGNPLFVEEMLQMLHEDGALEEPARAVVGTAGATPLTVPPSIHALVGARLDRLKPEERAVIRGAAVIGKVFWWGAVLDLVPDDLRPRVGPILQGLVRRELIAPEPSALVGEDAFRFHHLVIQESAYLEIPKELRAELHGRFATWLERTAGDRIGESEEILAYHLERAAASLVELGRSGEATDELIDRAGRSLASAGRRALARGDMSAAATLLGRAHEILPIDDPRRLALLPELGQALGETGEIARAEDLLTLAVARASAAGDRGLEAHARIVLLLLKESTDPEHRSEEALVVLEGIIPVLEDLGDDLGLARAWRLLGDVYWTRSSYENVDRALERAIEHARAAGAVWEEAESLRLYAGSGLYGPTPVQEVVGRCERIMELGKGNPTAEAGALRTLGVLNAMQGRIQEGRDLVRESATILEGLGQKIRASFTSEAAGFVEMLDGDVFAAERVLRAGYEELTRLGELGYRSTAAAQLAHPIAAQGRLDEAEELCRVADEIAAEDDIATQVVCRSARAKILAARGRLEDAAALAREAVSIGERADDINMLADALMDLAQVLRSTGASASASAGADEAIRRAHELYTRKGNVVSAARAERLAAGRP